MNGGGYMVILYSRKWRLPRDFYYFPKTEDGLRMAKAKRSELMAKYLDNDVELHVYDTKAG